MKKGKITTLLVCTLLCLSSMLIISNKIRVEASGGDGGNEGVNLNYTFLWEVTEELCDIIYTQYDESVEIPKGRAFGSKGGNYAANYTNETMEKIGLEDNHQEKMKHIDGVKKNYTSIIDVISANLTINNETYNYSNNVPITQFFPSASGWPDRIFGDFDYKTVFTNAKLYYNDLTDWKPQIWANSVLNITNYVNLNDISPLLGNVSYIPNNESIPDPLDQYDKVFLFNETEEGQKIMDNLSYPSGCVVIDTAVDYSMNTSTADCTVARINESSGDDILEILENYSTVIVDDFDDDLTFSYDFDEELFPSSGYVVIDRIPDHNEMKNKSSDLLDLITNGNEPNLMDYIGCYYLHTLLFRIFQPIRCKGYLLYNSFDQHAMWCTLNSWNHENDSGDWLEYHPYALRNFLEKGAPALPTFMVNYTCGNFLNSTRFGSSGTTISGDITQKFYEETTNSTGVEAYNVIGNLTIDKSPNDEIVIISNRYDGMWGQTPGDSGIGTAIMLAIAKYFTENNITPKYNLTFLFTTAEEYIFRGAQHYRDTLIKRWKERNETENIHLWIGTDQLGFNQAGAPLAPQFGGNKSDSASVEKAKQNRKIVWAIANDTQYDNRTGYKYGFKPFAPMAKDGTEERAWRDLCETICIQKDNTSRVWDRWHSTGQNYTEGDSLDYTDYNDVEITFELVWNITKYFTVNPDCWFDSYSEITLDSPDDGDYLNDSIKATFTVKTILPHDLVMVNATLKNVAEDIVSQTFMNFTVNSTGRQESVTLTIPENEPPGNYTLFLELYNSTGRINEIVEIGDNNYNDTTSSSSYFMYPYNFDKFPSEITDVSASPDPVGFGFGTTISASVTDNASYVNNVSVNITYPNNNWGNFTMTNTGGNTYQYVFSDTWLVGQYNYTIWTLDNSSNSNTSSGHSFNVSAQADISVCTIKDNYTSNEIINLTDPPRAELGYELLDDNNVLHIWNKHNGYYFDTSSGIQLTNHYDEYWSHNVLMLGYYNNDRWNLIYRTDELSGFNKDIDSDNETYVNVTLWKGLTYEGYDFRFAIRYYLGEDDPDLTVIPTIKNLGDAIPYNLAFGWEIKDIKIANTYENDTIRLYNGTDWISYHLNQTLNNTYTEMDYNTTFYLEGHNEDEYLKGTLYLRWNHTLDYILKVKSRTGQYNAPVTLFIEIGTLAVGQEKYTMMNWLDSDKWLGVNGWNYHSSCGHTWPDNPWGALNGTGVWTHMVNESHWLVIDLNETYNIKKIRGRSDTSDDPTSVDIYISDDPTNWASAVHTGITTWQDTSTWVEVDITDTVGRYVNISITDTEGMGGDNYLMFGKLPTPMTILDVYGEKVSTATYYFNSYDTNIAWATNPANMVDGNTSTYASTTIDNDIEFCNGNTCSGTILGNITKVELRVYGYYASNQRDIILRPVFGGSNPGSEYPYETASTAGWSPWFNITNDAQAPANWDWTDIANLDCEVTAEFILGGPMFTLYCSKVEIRVVYYPGVQIINPYPADGSIGVPLIPTLNITVTHPRGNTMNITWLSNSSGSWQIFGTNNSVTNGTYRQIFSNATENGKWWYWMVNVSDGNSYNESDVYKFYTGYQSKIKNTGSTSIKGYLLIQVQYHNTSSSTWSVANDTINETTPRTIHWDDPNTSSQYILALDTIFNGLVNTSSLSSYGNGTYRIYAAFRDPDGNILKCDDETELVATYEFTITFA